jgi:hypothetical protein
LIAEFLIEGEEGYWKLTGVHGSFMCPLASFEVNAT